MRTFGTIFWATFRQYSTYRAATAAGAVTNTVFGLVRASILLAAIGAAGGEVAGYSALQAMTYVWLGQGLIALIDAFGTRETGQRIHSGDIAVDLLRPMDLLTILYAQKLGRSAFLLLGRGLPPLVVGGLITGLALPDAVLPYALGAFSLLLAVTVAFLADTLMNLLAFWLVEVRGLQVLYMVVMNLLSGFLIPITWFPDWLLAIARFSPFPSMVQTPIDVISGRIGTAESFGAIAVQLMWAAVLGVVATGVLRAGVRATEVQGG